MGSAREANLAMSATLIAVLGAVTVIVILALGLLLCNGHRRASKEEAEVA